MIKLKLDKENSILHVCPEGALEKDDFEEMSQTVDPFIENKGEIAGIIIETAEFPGWKDFGSMASHFRFVRDHHRHIRRIAFVTDSALGNVAEKFASHFVSAEIKQFPAGKFQKAKKWIMNGQ